MSARIAGRLCLVTRRFTIDPASVSALVDATGLAIAVLIATALLTQVHPGSRPVMLWQRTA